MICNSQTVFIPVRFRGGSKETILKITDMNAKKYNGENNTINQFIIEMTLINPVSDIVKKLKNNEFRDCDIAYLDRKLMDYTSFACKTLNINASINDLGGKRDGVIMNDFVSKLYISRFETLLKYFETIKN